MPRKRTLTKLTAAQIERTPSLKRVSKAQGKLPRKAMSAARARSSMKRWLASQKPPAAPRTREKAVTGVKLKSQHLDRLRAVHDSSSPTAEFVGQKFTPDSFMGELYSALATYEYSKLQAEYKKRKANARTTAAQAKVEDQWSKIVEAGGEAFRAAGVKNVKQASLDQFSKELRRARSNFNAVVNIANTGKAVSTSSASTFSKITGGFVAQTAVLPDFTDVAIPFPIDICEEPLLDGKYTKHISKSFSLTVKLTVWCPTWTNPFKTCKKTFTIAGASFSLDLEVGYSVTCCGASAWGLAAAEACVTVIGIKVCASCQAKVTGVAGISRSTSGSTCSYGLGVTAELKCTLAGVTVFYAAVPFGWTLTGPCPPKILPC